MIPALHNSDRRSVTALYHVVNRACECGHTSELAEETDADVIAPSSSFPSPSPFFLRLSQGPFLSSSSSCLTPLPVLLSLSLPRLPRPAPPLSTIPIESRPAQYRAVLSMTTIQRLLSSSFCSLPHWCSFSSALSSIHPRLQLLSPSC